MWFTTPQPRDDPDEDLLSELPELDDDEAHEAPFEPSDDADLALLSEQEERVTDQDLAEAADDVATAELQDSDREEWVSEDDMEPAHDLTGADSDLLGGVEDGWTEGTEDEGAGSEDEATHLDGLEENTSLGPVSGLSADDGEEGLPDDDTIGDPSAVLPAADWALDEDEDEDEDEDGDEPRGEGVSDPRQGGLPAASAAGAWDERIEVWPGVRWAVLSPSLWECVSVVSQARPASAVYAPAGDALYVWDEGTLARYAAGGPQPCTATGVDGSVVTLAVEHGVVWAATPDAVFRSEDRGQRFARVCATPAEGPPRMDLVGRGAVWLQQGDQLFRFSPGARCFMPASPVQSISMWATDGAGAMVLSQPSGPLLRSLDGGFRWTEVALAVDGVSDLWVRGEVAVVATAQGLLASRGREWLQLMPPSATVCAVVGEPTVPRLYGCVAYPEGWVLARRPCNDASWRPRVVMRLDPSLGAPVFLSAYHRAGRTTLHLVAESGMATVLVKDA